MNLKTFEHDLNAGAAHFAIDVRHPMATLATDAKAEAQHLADPTRRESIIERQPDCWF